MSVCLNAGSSPVLFGVFRGLFVGEMQATCRSLTHSDCRSFVRRLSVVVHTERSWLLYLLVLFILSDKVCCLLPSVVVLLLSYHRSRVVAIQVTLDRGHNYVASHWSRQTDRSRGGCWLKLRLDIDYGMDGRRVSCESRVVLIRRCTFTFVLFGEFMYETHVNGAFGFCFNAKLKAHIVNL